MNRIGCAWLALLLLVSVGSAADRPLGSINSTRSEVIAPHGMVATSHPLAAQIGLEILRKGGSAMDAAIATNAAMGLMVPGGNGIGGDLFAIVWDPKTERLYGLNGSGRSPMGLTREEFEELGHTESVPYMGPLSISVPGCVDAWFTLHERFGKLPVADLLRPTIAYAEAGVPVPEVTAMYWQLSHAVRRDREGQFGYFETFSMPDGGAPMKGELWRNPALARTLSQIAEGGRDAFYEGSIAERIESYVQSVGGYLTKADLASHRSEWVDPVATNYRGWDVWQLPPNGQGLAVLQMLNILEGYDLASHGFGSVAHLHALIEAKKLAYEDRAKFYADPAFAAIPLDVLISKTYAAERRALIDPTRAGRQYAPGVLQHGDTIYLCTADKDGMMVSLIQSNFAGFGSGVCDPELGFGFQNRGASFTFEEGHANAYEPGKRPFHTIIPGFVTENGIPLMAFGVLGGSMQPQGQTQIVINMKDFGMNLQEAGDAPRINHEGSTQPYGAAGSMTDGGTVLFESGFDPAVIRDLSKMRHRMQQSPGWSFGGYQAIYRDPETGMYFGASESRSDGQAVGY